MKILRALALSLITVAMYGQATLTVSGARVKDVNGNPFTGMATFTVTDLNDVPISYTLAGGQSTQATFPVVIVGGAVQNAGGYPPTIGNPATMTPTPSRYRITLTTKAGVTTLNFPLTTIISGNGNYSLDSYQVASGLTVSGAGIPHVPCSAGAQYNDTTNSNPYPWVCSSLLNADGIYWTQNPSLNPACPSPTQATASPLGSGVPFCVPSTSAYATPGMVLGSPVAGSGPVSLHSAAASSLSQAAIAAVGPLLNNISGNAGTATALATAGSGCPAGQYAAGVDAKGNALGCAVPPGAALTQQTIANVGALLNSTSGNAATATALAKAGTACPSGQYAQGVDASGNATGCAAPTGPQNAVAAYTGSNGALGNLPITYYPGTQSLNGTLESLYLGPTAPSIYPAWCAYPSIYCDWDTAPGNVIRMFNLTGADVNQKLFREMYLTGGIGGTSSFYLEGVTDDGNNEKVFFDVVNTSTAAGLSAMVKTINNTLDDGRGAMSRTFNSTVSGWARLDGSGGTDWYGGDNAFSDSFGSSAAGIVVPYNQVVYMSGLTGDRQTRSRAVTDVGSTTTAADEGDELDRDQWFERSPWVNAVAGGTGVDGNGHTVLVTQNANFAGYATLGTHGPIINLSRQVNMNVTAVSGGTLTATKSDNSAITASILGTLQGPVSMPRSVDDAAGYNATVNVSMTGTCPAAKTPAVVWGSATPERIDVINSSAISGGCAVNANWRYSHPSGDNFAFGGYAGWWIQIESGTTPPMMPFVNAYTVSIPNRHVELVFSSSSTGLTAGYASYSATATGYIGTGIHAIFPGGVVTSTLDTRTGTTSGLAASLGELDPATYSAGDNIEQPNPFNQRRVVKHSLYRSYDPFTQWVGEEMSFQYAGAPINYNWNTYAYPSGSGGALFYLPNSFGAAAIWNGGPNPGSGTQSPLDGVAANIGDYNLPNTGSHSIYAAVFGLAPPNDGTSDQLGFLSIDVSNVSRRLTTAAGMDFGKPVTVSENSQAGCAGGIQCGEYGAGYLLNGPTPLGGGFEVFNSSVSLANYLGGFRYLRGPAMADGSQVDGAGNKIGPYGLAESPDYSLANTWAFDTHGEGFHIINNTATDKTTAWVFNPNGTFQVANQGGSASAMICSTAAGVQYRCDTAPADLVLATATPANGSTCAGHKANEIWKDDNFIYACNAAGTTATRAALSSF